MKDFDQVDHWKIAVQNGRNVIYHVTGTWPFWTHIISYRPKRHD